MGKYLQSHPLFIQNELSTKSLLLQTCIQKISMMVLLGVAILNVTGCGQKGELYLPESTQSSAHTLPEMPVDIEDVNSPALPISQPIDDNNEVNDY